MGSPQCKAGGQKVWGRAGESGTGTPPSTMTTLLLLLTLRDTMLTVMLVLTTLVLHVAECSSGSVERLLSSLQDTLQSGQRSSQFSVALRNFKSFSCTVRQDGVYPELTSGCSLYYRCLDGAVYSYSCPPREALDYSSGECRPAREMTCPQLPPTTPPCQNQTDGYYPDYSHDCKAYYRCSNGSMSGEWRCEDGAVWDTSTGSCGRGSSLVCSPQSCWGLPDGPHPAPASSCTSYFTCNNGVRTDHVCPYSTIFDYSLKRCVASTSTVCYEQACEGRPNGLYAAPHAPCHAFFRCFIGALAQLDECPRHQIFDGIECVTPSNFSCWGEGRGSCEGREDGFHVAANSDCRGFFLCRSKQFIRAFRCSQGLVFNGQRCVDDQNSICTSRPRLPDCSTKIDGYYTLEKTGCKTFFHCRAGNKLSEHTCPGSNVFNGEQCVDPVLYPCPSRAGPQHPRNLTNRVVRSRRTRDADCSSRPNGYYVDMVSHCTRFYYCRAGTKEITHSCPSQQKFNGVRCVPGDDYKCPAIPGAAECTVRSDGVYQDVEESCSSYYQCNSGLKIQYRCPEGQLHDGQVCRAGSQVYCPPSTLCYYHNDGTFVDSDRGCQGYFHCQNETLMWYRNCAPGQVHNGLECVPGFFYTCPAGMNTACVAKADGLYQDLSTGCRKYYRCSRGALLQRKECPSDMIFNGLGCVRRSTYVCPADGTKECGVNQKGFFQDIQSGCRRYYYCYDGQRFSKQCPEDKVFNGLTCVPGNQYKCPVQQTTISAQCSEVDGYYPDIMSGCRDFYYCRSGHRINHTCPHDLVFNGFECVPKDQFTCPGIPSCKGKVNGFYQDVLSNCRKYFYCHDGAKQEYTCPGEQVHDGRTCVPASTFVCPSPAHDHDCTGRHTGYYTDKTSSCQKYFLCRDGVKLKTMTCPPKQVFNGHTCVPSYNFSCSFPQDTSSTQSNRIDAPTKHFLSEAKVSSVSEIAYDEIGSPAEDASTYLKSPVTLFEENSFHDIPAVSTHNSASVEYEDILSATSTCLGLPHGSYTDVDSQCQRFLVCGENPNWFRCPSSLLFNPVSRACEQSSRITCPALDSCKHLDDGVYSDTESQCRIFYACRSKRMRLVSACPKGQAFSQRHGECRVAGEVLCGGVRSSAAA